MLDITDEINKVVEESETKEGICLLFAPHASCALLINENEPGFKADMEKLLSMWLPENGWEHNKVDDNATAHLGASLISQSRSIPIGKGGLLLGIWQQVFLLELDGPRSGRKVIIQTVADK